MVRQGPDVAGHLPGNLTVSCDLWHKNRPSSVLTVESLGKDFNHSWRDLSRFMEGLAPWWVSLTETLRSELPKLVEIGAGHLLCDLVGSCVTPSHAVVKFMDVYQRSYCRPIETLVDIFQEYPDEIEYIFKPSCVPLMRCGGCCNDEGLECVPTEEFNITMQVGTRGEWSGGHLGGGARLALPGSWA